MINLEAGLLMLGVLMLGGYHEETLISVAKASKAARAIAAAAGERRKYSDGWTSKDGGNKERTHGEGT